MPQLMFIVGIASLLTVVLVGVLIVLMRRLFYRQDTRAAEEATRLREMLLDVLSEQEAVTIRQAQMGSSLSTMQTQLGKLASAPPVEATLSPQALAEIASLPQLEQRFAALQQQIGSWIERGTQDRQEQQLRDSQSWSSLTGLLAAMQDRIAELNDAVGQPQANLAADRLMQELDSEMQNLRMLSDEISGLQWKLRRSVLERETSLAALRAQVRGGPKFDHRAA
jgi:hypothetical protein